MLWLAAFFIVGGSTADAESEGLCGSPVADGDIKFERRMRHAAPRQQQPEQRKVLENRSVQQGRGAGMETYPPHGMIPSARELVTHKPLKTGKQRKL